MKDETNCMYQPIRIIEIDASLALPDILATSETGITYRNAYVFVRYKRHSLGILEFEIPDDRLTSEFLTRQIYEHYRSQIIWIKDNSPDELSPIPDKQPFVSIIIATKDRADMLRVVLKTLLEQDYPNYEIVVVDNAPKTDATHNLINTEFMSYECITYIREDTPGLSNARNCGLKQACGDIIAFTDDDVRVDRYWLSSLINGFYVDTKVMCVTGLTLPAELETQFQAWFEQFGGFAKGFNQRVYDRDVNREHNILYPYTAGTFGSGVNMAFKAKFLRDIGGFDPALGAGTRTAGGEDLAAYFSVISTGYQIVYQPDAIVYHYHRRDYESLEKQILGYGKGLTAFLTKCVIDNPIHFFRIVGRMPYGLYYIFSPQSKKNRKKTNFPSKLTRIERRGMLSGPWSYVSSRFANRQNRTG